MDEYIIHYGIKGMKWGVRKDDYHTKNGPALSTGSNGYGGNPVVKNLNKFIANGHPEASSNNGSDKDKADEAKKKKDEKLDKAVKGMNATGRTAKSGSSAAKKIGNVIRSEEQKKIDLSEMSDAELQKRVNRLNLERQYNTLSTQDTARGWEKAGEVLDIFGDVVMIGVGIATIYKTFH